MSDEEELSRAKAMGETEGLGEVLVDLTGDFTELGITS